MRVCCGNAAGSPAVGVSDRRSAALIAAAFFALGAAVSADIGVTADEFETLRAGERNLEIVAAAASGRPRPEWSFHELEGFYFVLDTARALWIRGFAALGLDDAVRAQHLAQLALSSITLGLVFAIARLAGATRRAALLAAVALATLPKFVAHSQNNPKDLPAAFAFTLAIYAILVTGLRGGVRRAVLGGVALGLALTTRVHAAFAPMVAWSWLALARPAPTRRDVQQQALLLAVGLLAAFVFWPWLWPAPVANALDAARDVTSIAFAIPVLYLGDIYPANEVPWHYRPVLLLATTPASLLAIAALGAAAGFARGADAGARNTARLGAIWLGVLWLADGLASSRYDGLRHFLMALPALALLAGVGADRAICWTERHSMPRAVGLLPLVPFAIGAIAILTLHPYANAALGAPARLAAGNETDRLFELEYWGQSYLEGGRWIERHAEPDAEVIVPLFAEGARYTLGDRVREAGVADWARTDRPRYLMLMARRAYYDAALRELTATRKPDFEIRRSGGRLLAIYRNDARR